MTGQRPWITRDATDRRRAASAPVCRRHAWLEVSQAHSATWAAMHRPIRQRLFGCIAGAPNECGGDGLTSRSPGGKRRALFRRVR